MKKQLLEPLSCSSKGSVERSSSYARSPLLLPTLKAGTSVVNVLPHKPTHGSASSPDLRNIHTHEHEEIMMTFLDKMQQLDPQMKILDEELVRLLCHSRMKTCEEEMPLYLEYVRCLGSIF